MNTDVRSLRNMLALATRYVAICLPLFAVWEIAQLPLYTILAERGVRASVLSALHCTIGDAMIAFFAIGAALMAGLFLPCMRRFSRIALTTVLLGLVTTVAIEWLSVQSGRWGYSGLMPVDPWLSIGLSPLLQWLVIPVVGVRVLGVRLRQWFADLDRIF